MRSEPTIIVTCDICNQWSEEINLITTARGYDRGYDERNVDNALEDMGWLIENSLDICPDCKRGIETYIKKIEEQNKF